MKSLLLLLVSMLFTSSFLFSQEKQSFENPYPKFVPYAVKQNTSEQEIANLDIKNLGKEQPARWMSVDPMADKYPGWSPYHYSLNNPLRYIDPNGMWSAERDENGNIIARYEDGDTYENLYTQLGMSTEQFASWTASQGIELSLDGSGMSFNITNFVVSNNSFDPNFTGSNCHGFVTFATGNTQVEGQLGGNELLTTIGNPQFSSSPITGNVAVWPTQGQVDGVDLSGQPAHSAIFILNNQAGESQYLQRLGTNHPVSIGTGQQITSFYKNLVNEFQTKYNVTMPTMGNHPQYYKVK